MRHSLIVQAKSLEEALNKAAVLLHCAKEAVAYEILQAPKPGRYGQPGTPCKLRACPVAGPVEEESQAGLEGLFEKGSTLPLPPADLGVLSPSAFLALLASAGSEPEPEAAPEETPVLEAAERRDIVGDVSPLTTGVLAHAGDLRIYGSVRKGMVVKAAGSIQVIGDVETAVLDAGGDIAITGGLLGSVRSAQGQVTCRFAQGARINAPQGDITVQESAMHAHLHAGRGVTVGDIVLGGTCYGECWIEARIAGSESGVPALLQSGPNRRLYDELEEIRRQAQVTVQQLSEQVRVTQALRPYEERGEARTTEERVRLWHATVQSARLHAILARLARQKERRLGMINSVRSARIGIASRAYPKVKISIDELTWEVPALTQFACFTRDYELGEIRMTPFH